MSKTTLETFLPDRRYTWGVPAPAPTAQHGTNAPVPEGPPDTADDIPWDTFLMLLEKALRPFPGAAISVSQEIRGYLGKPLLHPINFDLHENPA